MAELAEEMVAAWLRFKQNCILVECGWRLPPVLIKAGMEKLDENAMATWEAAQQKELIPLLVQEEENQRKRIGQTLRQMEIDVVGYRWSHSLDGQPPSLIPVEVAFHGNGLRYGRGDRAKANADRVGKKLFLNTFALRLLGLPVQQFYFVTHKLDSGSEEQINEKVDAVKGMYPELADSLRFEIITSDKLREQVLLPLREAAPGLGNTGNAFIRSLQILQGVDLQAAKKPKKVAEVSAVGEDEAAKVEVQAKRTPEELLQELLEFKAKEERLPKTTSSNAVEKSLATCVSSYLSKNQDKALTEVYKAIQKAKERNLG